MSSSDPTKPSLIPLVIALIIFAATGWYGYNKYSQITTLKTNLAQADVVLLDLEKDKNQVIKDYQAEKKNHFEKAGVNQEKLVTVFPDDEDITTLTRLFDDFAFKNHYLNNPFFISQMSYGEIVENEGENFRIIPITISLETSEKNFFKFLEFIENSGSVESGVRLLSSNAITLQLSEASAEAMNVQLSLQAYIQK